MKLPPNVQANDNVLLFDGICKLCNVWANFVVANDKQQRIKLCSMQSSEGQKILAHFGLPTDRFDSMVYVQGEKYAIQSDSFFDVMNTLGMPWKILNVFSLFPKGLRDWAYDRIALNRHKLFGTYDYCRMPAAEQDNRYVVGTEKTEAG